MPRIDTREAGQHMPLAEIKPHKEIFRDNYEAVRAEAQSACDADGFDRGMTRETYGHWFMRLPAKQFRGGGELLCELVMCSDLAKCQPGHGP
jgi:hypothetical protein